MTKIFFICMLIYAYMNMKFLEDHILKLKALSDGNRLRVYRVLLKAPGLCVCEFSDILGIEQYNVSRCLKELKSAGLALQRREGRWMSYYPAYPESDFHKHLVRAVESLKSELFSQDLTKLLKRLSLRKNGKCVLGKIDNLDFPKTKEEAENA